MADDSSTVKQQPHDICPPEDVDSGNDADIEPSDSTDTSSSLDENEETIPVLGISHLAHSIMTSIKPWEQSEDESLANEQPLLILGQSETEKLAELQLLSPTLSEEEALAETSDDNKSEISAQEESLAKILARESEEFSEDEEEIPETGTSEREISAKSDLFSDSKTTGDEEEDAVQQADNCEPSREEPKEEQDRSPAISESESIRVSADEYGPALEEFYSSPAGSPTDSPQKAAFDNERHANEDEYLEEDRDLYDIYAEPGDLPGSRVRSHRRDDSIGPGLSSRSEQEVNEDHDDRSPPPERPGTRMATYRQDGSRRSMFDSSSSSEGENNGDRDLAEESGTSSPPRDSELEDFLSSSAFDSSRTELNSSPPQAEAKTSAVKSPPRFWAEQGTFPRDPPAKDEKDMQPYRVAATTGVPVSTTLHSDGKPKEQSVSMVLDTDGAVYARIDSNQGIRPISGESEENGRRIYAEDEQSARLEWRDFDNLNGYNNQLELAEQPKHPAGTEYFQLKDLQVRDTVKMTGARIMRTLDEDIHKANLELQELMTIRDREVPRGRSKGMNVAQQKLLFDMEKDKRRFFQKAPGVALNPEGEGKNITLPIFKNRIINCPISPYIKNLEQRAYIEKKRIAEIKDVLDNKQEEINWLHHENKKLEDEATALNDKNIAVIHQYNRVANLYITEKAKRKTISAKLTSEATRTEELRRLQGFGDEIDCTSSTDSTESFESEIFTPQTKLEEVLKVNKHNSSTSGSECDAQHEGDGESSEGSVHNSGFRKPRSKYRTQPASGGKSSASSNSSKEPCPSNASTTESQKLDDQQAPVEQFDTKISKPETEMAAFIEKHDKETEDFKNTERALKEGARSHKVQIRNLEEQLEESRKAIRSTKHELWTAEQSVKEMQTHLQKFQDDTQDGIATKKPRSTIDENPVIVKNTPPLKPFTVPTARPNPFQTPEEHAETLSKLEDAHSKSQKGQARKEQEQINRIKDLENTAAKLERQAKADALTIELSKRQIKGFEGDIIFHQTGRRNSFMSQIVMPTALADIDDESTEEDRARRMYYNNLRREKASELERKFEINIRAVREREDKMRKLGKKFGVEIPEHNDADYPRRLFPKEVVLPSYLRGDFPQEC